MAQPISDREWQARDDAHTLVQSEVIKSDPARLQAAKVQAKTMAEEKAKEKQAMDKVAKGAKGPGTATNTQTGKKTPTSPRGGASGVNHNVFTKLK